MTGVEWLRSCSLGLLGVSARLVMMAVNDWLMLAMRTILIMPTADRSIKWLVVETLVI